MNRRRGGSLAGSPLLIGAVTTLIVVVAVYLSYNANNGLPFVPTYNIKVALPEASGLQHRTSRARRRHARRASSSGSRPHQNPATGQVTAIAELKLEKKVEPLPADTTASVQSVSSIGLKYLELEKGNSQSGRSSPARRSRVSQTREPVNIEELFNMFDKKTRTANQMQLNNFGDGLAGRGLGLNNTIATLRPLRHERRFPCSTTWPRRRPACTSCSSRSTGSPRRPPRWPTPQAALYVRPRQILHRLGERGVPSLEGATVGGPPSLEQAIYSLPYEAKFTKTAPSSCTCCAPARACS